MKSGKNVYLTAEELAALRDIVRAARLQAEESQKPDDIPPYVFKKIEEKLNK